MSTTPSRQPMAASSSTPSTSNKKKKDSNRASPDSCSSDNILVEHPPVPSQGSSKDDNFLPISSDNNNQSSPSSLLKLDKRSCLTKFLQGYSSFMTSGANVDKGIKLLQYTLWMIGHYGVSSSSSQRVIVRDSIQKLFFELSFSRYILRFFHLPGAIEAVQSDAYCRGSVHHPTLHKWLGRILAWSMIGYYPLEHGAYVQWQTPKLMFSGPAARDDKYSPPSRLAEKLSAWSCRFWLIYTVTEIVQSWLALREEKQKLIQSALAIKKDDHRHNNHNNNNNNDDDSKLIVPAMVPESSSDEEEEDAATKQQRQEISTSALVQNSPTLRNLRLQILRDVLFTLPAVHWSLPNWDKDPFLSPPVLNTLMWLETVVCMYQAVKNYQD